MSTDPHLTLQLARLHAATVAADIRDARRRRDHHRSARRAATSRLAPVVGLSPPRAGRDPTALDRRVA